MAFDILRCWTDDHLQTCEYSLQGKYKREVTNTTEHWQDDKSGGRFSLFCLYSDTVQFTVPVKFTHITDKGASHRKMLTSIRQSAGGDAQCTVYSVPHTL